MRIDGRQNKRTLESLSALDVGAFNDALLAFERSADERLDEAVSSESHRKGSRSSAVLGLDDLVTTVLDALGQRLDLLLGEGKAGLRKERDDGDTRVASNNGNLGGNGVGALDFGNKGGSTNDIEGRDTKETLGVVDTSLLEDLGGDRDGRVDGVRDDANEG